MNYAYYLEKIHIIMYVLVEHRAIQSKWLVNCRLYDSTLMSGSYEIHKASFN